MFGIGSTELVIILIVALVLIGPSKLPDLMKSLGKGLSEFRRMSTDVKSTLEREIERADEAKRIEETKKELFGDEPVTAEAKKDETAKPAETVQAAGADAKTVAEAADQAKPERKPVATDAAKPEIKPEAKEATKPAPKDPNHA